jgi:hypothetical protein
VTGIRRGIVVLTAVIGVLTGVMGPAQASLASKTAAFTAKVTTITVAAPTSVSTNGTRCSTRYDWSTGTTTTTLNAKVSWPASTTARGVTGYLVTAVFSDGTRYPVAQVAAPATSISGDFDAYYATQNIRVTVTTLTSYGWTAESPMSGVIRC